VRLLVLSNNYPPLVMGGYELLCQDHVGWLRRQGHDIDVITSTFGLDRGSPTIVEVGGAGETVHRVLDFHWKDFKHRRPNFVSVWSGELRQRRAVETLLREHKPDVALIWGMAVVSKSVLGVIHRSGIPMLAIVGEAWPAWDVDSDTWVRLWSRMPQALVSWADRVIAPTRVWDAIGAMTPAYASAELGGQIEATVEAWRGKGIVVSNGVQADRFDSGRDLASPLSKPLRLLYAGRIERRKGVHTAVEALGHLVQQGAEARLTIVGWGDREYEADLRRMAESDGAGAFIDWRGAVGRDSMRDVYREHDVLLFPTIWPEPFGLVALEALAAGCVVVATGTGGSSAYLLDGETALLFPVEDARALASQISALLAKPELVRTLRAGGAKTVASHSFEAYAHRLDELIRETAILKTARVPA
jgi:glycosyltransferase involved in cell wall biosynthesis